MKRIFAGVVSSMLALTAGSAMAQGKPPLKLGAILDMSGLYADITGVGSETAAKMAAEDFGGEVLGRKIEIVAADHLNKADLASSIARDMFDNQGVEAIIDVAASATALAANEIAKARNKIIVFNGPGSIRLTNEACGPYTVHYVFDTFGQANSTGLATVKAGLDTWFFLQADYAFGQDLEKDTSAVINKMGGKVLGTVKHPLNTSDFSSFLLQAQGSKAKVVGLANAAGKKVGFGIAPESDVMGVNDRSQLARAEAIFQADRRDAFMKAGVTLRDPNSVWFSWDTEIGRDVTIFPNVVFGPGVKIADNVEIRAFCDIEDAVIGEGASIGPFARIRGGAELGPDVHLGNFVEVKKSKIGAGTKAGHLSYLGDAEIGSRTNIGAGTITCNYDGVNKDKTIIGDNVFIGSNASLVAPVTIGDGAYTASGSVITQDVPADALALGRARQENKPGYAPRLKERALAKKAAKGK